MGGLLQTLRGLGPARLGLMGAVMVGMIIFFFFLTTRMSSGQMGLLYSDLPTGDAASITAKLETMQVPYQVSADGAQIKVPVEQVGKLRMAMAADGLPSGGGVGYEIFDKQNSFGTTSFVQNINQLRALEGELARTISTMEGVRAARVNLVLPQRELFAKETQPATASIFLTLRGSTTMTREQIAAIQHLVAAAVPMLKPQAISIVDNAGNLLARGSSDGDNVGGGDQSGDDVRRTYETRIQNQIEDLLARTVGYGHVRATVTADLDFDRVVTNEEKYDPEGQVARSTQTVTDKSSSTDNSSNGGTVSVANNLPAGQGANSAAGGASGSNNNRSEETTNYEIGKKITNSVKEIGAVKKLSVAVLVDGTYTTDEKDKTKQTYAPRTKEEMASYEDLVKSAIGFDDKRGDSIKVENMKFTHDAEAAPEPTLPLGFTKEDLTKLLETVVLGLVAIMFILLVVKPLTTRVMATVPAPMPGGGGFAMPGNPMLTDQSGAGSAPQLGGPNYNPEQLAERAMAVESEIERMINLEQVEGRVRASSLKKISEIVDKHPEQAVAILRQWLYQDPAR